MHVVMLAFPDMTQLDLTGPYEVFKRFREIEIDIVWKTLDPVRDASGLRILPDKTFATCAPADILFVPGGAGQLALMDDEETLAFLRKQAGGARYITSVCTGSLVLAAAGLLTGYKATCHWLSIDQLGHFGATPLRQRVVIDGNRVTGAGVTSWIDFALTLMANIFGDDRACLAQLTMEYDPKPPFAGGTEATSHPQLVAKVKTISAALQQKRDEAARRAAQRLRLAIETGRQSVKPS